MIRFKDAIRRIEEFCGCPNARQRLITVTPLQEADGYAISARSDAILEAMFLVENLNVSCIEIIGSGFADRTTCADLDGYLRARGYALKTTTSASRLDPAYIGWLFANHPEHPLDVYDFEGCPPDDFREIWMRGNVSEWSVFSEEGPKLLFRFSKRRPACVFSIWCSIDAAPVIVTLDKSLDIAHVRMFAENGKSNAGDLSVLNPLLGRWELYYPVEGGGAELLNISSEKKRREELSRLDGLHEGD